MKVIYLSLFLSSAYALVARTSSCCFDLTASGGPGGDVGQLSDGQNRLGQGLTAASYCINNGSITDGNGRGCILTSPTTQLQCDVGAVPTTGFSIDCNGTVSYNGTSKFWSCPTEDNGGYNIYSTPPNGQQGCVTITLASSSCAPVCIKTCPVDLSGNFQFPHLIVPIDSSAPLKAKRTSYDGAVSATVSTVFDFDIPISDSGKTCSLVFLFPTQSELVTSSYTISGAGTIDFSMLASPATDSTGFANAAPVGTDYGTFTVTPGTSTLISTFACPAGTKVGFEMKAVGDTVFTYFQDYNPSPIGLYITEC